MPGESLNFPIFAEDHASKNIREVGDAAASTAAKLDIAAVSAKLWNDTAIKQGRAADTAVAAMKSHTLATNLYADAERVLAGEATKTTKLMADQGTAFDKAGQAAEKAAGSGGTSGLSALIGGGGAGGGGIAGLIATGVVLSPVIATLAVGTVGFGAAAYGAAAPILKAAQATGGLSANMATLNPEQQQVARGLLGLGQQYSTFQKQLQPQVLGVFNQGLRLAGHLLHDVQPVAKATGTALGSVLGQIDAEFQSGTWQSFFGFMAKTAGPDIQQLGGLFVALMQDLPPVVEALQPLASGFLNVATDVAKAAQPLGTFATNVQGSAHQTDQAAKSLDSWTVAWTNRWIPGAKTVNRLLGNVQGSLEGNSAATAAAGRHASTAATAIQSMATATTNLMTAQSTALATQVTYGSDILTSANDAVALEKALDKSKNQIGLHTAAQRASFGAAQTYITDLSNQATAAVTSGHGTDAAILAIKKGLPVLDSAKTKNRQYWQEVQTLVGWLHNLENIKAIHETVFVTGNGTFTVRPGTKLGLPGGSAGGPFPQAAGGLLRGGIPGKDSIPILAMPGEVIVPTHMVSAGAVDHLRGRLPGFASGGLVPSYAGSVGGLPSWGGRDLNATVHIIEQAVVKATVAAIHAAARAAASIGGHAGPGGGAPSANAALAHRLYASQLSPASWAAWNFVAMAESGWNNFARNPSSGAYGIAQALPPTKYPFAGQAAGGSNPTAQITWMWDYMMSRYGGPLGAQAHEAAFRWYDAGGFLPTGPSLAMNTTGSPEAVVSPGSMGRVEALLKQLVAAVNAAPARTGDAVGGALNGAARSARYSGMYSSRGA